MQKVIRIVTNTIQIAIIPYLNVIAKFGIFIVARSKTWLESSYDLLNCLYFYKKTNNIWINTTECIWKCYSLISLLESDQNLRYHKLTQEQTFICNKLTDHKTFIASDLSEQNVIQLVLHFSPTLQSRLYQASVIAYEYE